VLFPEVGYAPLMRHVSAALQVAMFGRMALAALFGFLIGFEREYRGKAAGERTFALVALGAAAFTAVGVELFPPSAEKVIAGVATGIGFLGIGIIWRMEGRQSRGLTTAATGWTVASLGVIVGTGLYLTGVLVTALSLLILEADRLPLLGGALRKIPDPMMGGSEPPGPENDA
jgi:putative Mg2+ transporter-C (MgtC) family protein